LAEGGVLELSSRPPEILLFGASVVQEAKWCSVGHRLNRQPGRTEFPRKPLTHDQLEDLANQLAGIEPCEIHLIRDDFAFDCVEIGNQLQKFFIDLNWPVTRPNPTFYDPIEARIRVRAMAGDQTAEAIRRALARVLKISIGAASPRAQNINWVEIEIGRIF
jgi:hypothetical protein